MNDSFQEFEGALWRGKVMLRPVFKRTYGNICTTQELKATLRAGPSVWPGGYPLFFIADDGEALSFESVRANFRQVLSAFHTRTRDGWRVVGCAVNWEDPTLRCAHTGDPIKSAYAAPAQTSEERDADETL